MLGILRPDPRAPPWRRRLAYPLKGLFMRRLLCLVWLLAVALLGLACGDDDDGTVAPPDGDVDVVDLAAFEGCWHLRSQTDVLAPEGTPCRRAIDSVVAFFEINGSDSVFATIDTVTHLSFVPPYRGTGNYAGTNIPGRKGR